MIYGIGMVCAFLFTMIAHRGDVFEKITLAMVIATLWPFALFALVIMAVTDWLARIGR